MLKIQPTIEEKMIRTIPEGLIKSQTEETEIIAKKGKKKKESLDVENVGGIGHYQAECPTLKKTKENLPCHLVR